MESLRNRGRTPGIGCTANGSTTVRSSATATVGQWYPVAGVKTDTEIAIYVNGIKKAAKPIASFLNTHSAELIFCTTKSQGLSAGFSGSIDEVSLLNPALSDTEFEGIVQAGSQKNVDVGQSRQTQSFTYNPIFNQFTSVSDELGRQSLFEIDPTNGNTVFVTEIVDEVDATRGETDDVVTRFTCIASGQVDTRINPGASPDFERTILELGPPTAADS